MKDPVDIFGFLKYVYDDLFDICVQLVSSYINTNVISTILVSIYLGKLFNRKVQTSFIVLDFLQNTETDLENKNRNVQK